MLDREHGQSLDEVAYGEFLKYTAKVRGYAIRTTPVEDAKLFYGSKNTLPSREEFMDYWDSLTASQKIIRIAAWEQRSSDIEGYFESRCEAVKQQTQPKLRGNAREIIRAIERLGLKD